MTNPTPLSPAAQAVFNAYLESCDGAYNVEWYKGDLVMIAAALRAAALYTKRDRLILLSIAAELEGAQ